MDVFILDWTQSGHIQEKTQHLVTLAFHQVKGLFVIPSFHSMNKKTSSN